MGRVQSLGILKTDVFIRKVSPVILTAAEDKTRTKVFEKGGNSKLISLWSKDGIGHFFFILSKAGCIFCFDFQFLCFSIFRF